MAEQSTNASPVVPAGAPAKADPAQTPAPAPNAAPGASQGPSQATAGPDPRLEALKRAERELQGQREAWKAEQAKAKAELESQREAYRKWETAKKRAKQDPNALLAEHGLTYEELTEAALNDGKPTAGMVAKTVDEIRAEIQAEFDKRDQERAKEREAAEEERKSAALTAWRGQTTAKVKAAADKYPLIVALGVEAQVSQDIEAHYNQTGEEQPLDTAAEALEGRLTELVEKVLALEKYKGRLKDAPKAATSTPGTLAEAKAQDGGTVVPEKRHQLRERNTLTNADAPATNPMSSTRGKTPDQAWAELKRARGIE